MHFYYMEEKSSQGKELPSKDLITWALECVQRLKKGEMEAYTWVKFISFAENSSPTLTNRTFLITENIWISVMNPNTVKLNIPFLLAKTKPSKYNKRSCVLKSYYLILDIVSKILIVLVALEFYLLGPRTINSIFFQLAEGFCFCFCFGGGV